MYIISGPKALVPKESSLRVFLDGGRTGPPSSPRSPRRVGSVGSLRNLHRLSQAPSRTRKTILPLPRVSLLCDVWEGSAWCNLNKETKTPEPASHPRIKPAAIRSPAPPYLPASTSDLPASTWLIPKMKNSYTSSPPTSSRRPTPPGFPGARRRAPASRWAGRPRTRPALRTPPHGCRRPAWDRAERRRGEGRQRDAESEVDGFVGSFWMGEGAQARAAGLFSMWWFYGNGLAKSLRELSPRGALGGMLIYKCGPGKRAGSPVALQACTCCS